MADFHGIIFAYRSNPALHELIEHRNTASVPYGGRCRMIDFMLSNMVNAGIDDVGLIVHAGYQSLLDHVGSGKDWDLSRKHGGLRILPPFGYAGKTGDGKYHGRMDALSGVSSYLQRIRQDYVILSNGDLAANLPLDDVMEAHLRSGADITAVCTRNSKCDPRVSVYFSLGANGLVSDVSVNPAAPMGCESMEIYVLSRELLLSLTDYCAAHGISSFSGGVLSRMAATLKISPWFFSGYSARMQSVGSYFSNSMELLKPDVRADLFDPVRAIRTKDRSDPSTYYGPGSVCSCSLVADGCIIEGEVQNSILFRGVLVEKGARVTSCILMQGTQIEQGALLQYAITDKNVLINPGRMLMGHETYPLAIAKNSVI
jgi:glucose-1-phosphate adenylyltransferase